MKCNFDNKAIGKEIENRMMEKGITIREISQILNVSYHAVYKWVKGTALPDLPHFVTLAGILDTTVGQLLEHHYEIEK